MTTYTETFAGMTTGIDPTNFTNRFAAESGMSVEANTEAEDDRVLRSDGTDTGDQLFSFDDVDGDADRDNCESLARFKVATDANGHWSMWARASGSAGAETGIELSINATLLRIKRWNAGTPTIKGSNLSVDSPPSPWHRWTSDQSPSFTSTPADMWLYVRMRVNGTGATVTTQGRIWAVGQPEPTGWQITSADSDGSRITAAGWVGWGRNAHSGDTDLDYFSVGTNGDTVVLADSAELGPVRLTQNMVLAAISDTNPPVRITGSYLQVIYTSDLGGGAGSSEEGAVVLPTCSVVPGKVIRSISGDDFAQAIESNTRITSADALIEWQDEFITDPASGLTSIWEAQVITVEAANTGAYGASNGNAAEVTAPAGVSRKRMSVINGFGSFAQARVYFDVAIDTLPGSSDCIFSFGLRCTGSEGSENGYVFSWRNSATNTMEFYRMNGGVETRLASQDQTALLADTAYVVAIEAINGNGNKVTLRASVWAAVAGSEPVLWQTEFEDDGASTIKTNGAAGFAAPDTVAVQLRSAVKGPVCANMWDVTDVDFESEDGVTVVAQTLVSNVSGAYGFLEIPTPDFTGLSVGGLIARVTDAVDNYERPFTLGDPPIVLNGGGGVLPDTTRDDDTEVVVSNQNAGNNGGNNGNGGGVVNLPPQAGGPFSLTASIEGFDYASGKWYLMLESTEITGGNSQRRLVVAPGITDVTNEAANDSLPYMWRLTVVHGDSTAVVYSMEFKH
jgi:hypothetical protein